MSLQNGAYGAIDAGLRERRGGGLSGPIKGWDRPVVDWRLIVIVAVDECAGLVRQLVAEG